MKIQTVDKQVIYKINMCDGEEYRRLSYNNWEQLIGCSWEQCNPELEKQLDYLFDEYDWWDY